MGKPVDTEVDAVERLYTGNSARSMEHRGFSTKGLREKLSYTVNPKDWVSAADYDRLQSALTAAQQRIADLEAQCARVQKLADFGLRCLDDFQEAYGDLDGGWVQDTAVKCGVLVEVTATEPCDPEHCECAGMADFPTTCYRRAPDIADAAMAAKVEGEDGA